MKKILSVLISATIFASLLATPVLAGPASGYVKGDNDKVIVNETFDNGTTTNDIDGSPAIQVTATTDVLKPSDASAFTAGFYLSFDFRFDNVTILDGEGNPQTGPFGSFAIRGDGWGPNFSFNGTHLRNQKGGSSFENICPISAETWYTAEIEGKMVTSGENMTMKVYDAEGNQIGSVSRLDPRNFYNGGSNKKPSRMEATNVSIDNMYMVAEYPDNIAITTNGDKTTVRAGSSLGVGYVISRLEVPTTNEYDVTWTVYDATGRNEITDGSVYIADRFLRTTHSENDTTVVVRATAKITDDILLTDEKTITIEGVSLKNEPFDRAVVTGPDTVQAGTTTGGYTFTAYKDDVDVTDDLVAGEDYTWDIYDSDDVDPNENKELSIADDGSGTNTAALTVGDGVIPQAINVSVVSSGGLVRGSAKVTIDKFSDKQKEDVLVYNACEESINTATKVKSVDGSKAYNVTSNMFMGFSGHSDYTLTEFDIRFATPDAGVCFERDYNGGGKFNASFYLKNVNADGEGSIKTQTGGSSFTGIGVDATTDEWLHFEVLYSSGNASCIVTKYDENGKLGTPIKCLNIPRRNGDTYGCLHISAGVIIDNIKISVAQADEIDLTTPRDEVYAGDSLQLVAALSRNGLPMNSTDGVVWSVIDDEGLPILDETWPIQVSDSGVLSIDPFASAQTAVIQAALSEDVSDTVTVTVRTSELFSVDNIGINKEGTKITRLYINKNFNYNERLVFIIAIYDADGALSGIAVKEMYGDGLVIGENELPVELNIPAGFNPETDKVNVMVWTTFV